MIYTHGALGRSHREAQIHRRGVYSSSQQHLSTPPLTLPVAPAAAAAVPHHTRGLLTSSLSRETYLQILPDMRCCISLLHSSKKDIQVIGNTCSCFIPGKGVSLPGILLHLPMFSWYILHFLFNRIISLLKFSRKAREGLFSPVMACKHHLKELNGAASMACK